MRNLASALQMVQHTDTGLQRDHNEDAVLIDAAEGYAVLADGMGGYNAGEVASKVAAEVIAQVLRESIPLAENRQLLRHGEHAGALSLLADAVQRANLAVFEMSRSDRQYAGMGTTLVSALFYDNHVAVAHVGDSRLYRLRDEVLQQLTHDHSFLQEQIDHGLITAEEARYSGNKNLVTRAVGISPDLQVEVNEYDAQVGDLFLLCSDGLSDLVSEPEMLETLTVLRTNLPVAAAHLIQQANNLGGKDNISVILIAVQASFGANNGIWAKIADWVAPKPPKTP
ncbi:Stp1/IreP family PP2C-type Ser/Thr phosphatase [Amantichitinum ursilacus]|uniref:Serine/threonine phosphatase stp n=1 Tax=Amantichitinum ursilacus TaxID=857265 RepID=A0A0N0GPX6_9NEIS|nr:Stp1/IreP family PP2C-type Ser/Thr phosphatase [Amantichitinum ursilacus]KPC54132.1 Serine/threonine phosphatase stp [Amantichitinum ursilacus]